MVTDGREEEQRKALSSNKGSINESNVSGVMVAKKRISSEPRSGLYSGAHFTSTRPVQAEKVANIELIDNRPFLAK